MRTVVDTNAWVSALINPFGPPARLLRVLRAGRFTLIISLPLLDELAEVLGRPRLANRYGYTADDVADLLAVLRRGDTVPITGTLRMVRDADDDVVVETALLGHADVLVTRDDDLKGDSALVRVLENAGVRVLTVRRFLALLGVEVKS